MDANSIRLIIIISGVLVAAAMVAWSIISNRKNANLYGGRRQKTADDLGLDDGETPSAGFILPEIIQFSIVAPEDSPFTGEQLAVAFADANLKYTDSQIFCRQDAENDHYAVANMQEPGTFPDPNMQGLQLLGIVFILQPAVLADPLAAFDDLTHTINQIASTLDGFICDHTRQPLTEQTIQQFRLSLTENF